MSSSAAATPYLFHTPAGWREPSDAWIAVNQGWEPPLGWRPEASFPAAPEGWVFWETNEPVWEELGATARRVYRRQMLISAAIAVVGVILSLVLIAMGLGAAGIWIVGVAFLVLSLVIYPIRVRQVDSTVAARVVQTAEDERVRLGFSAGADGVEPAPYDGVTPVVALQRTKLNWAALVASGGFALAGFAPRRLVASRRSKVFVTALPFAVVVLALAFWIPTAVASLGGNGLDFDVRPASEQEAAEATSGCSDAGCWVFAVTLDETCDSGTPSAHIDFASTETGKPEKSTEMPLKDTRGDVQLVAVDGEDMPRYAGMTSVDCG